MLNGVSVLGHAFDEYNLKRIIRMLQGLMITICDVH